jgi:hypothetical protein
MQSLIEINEQPLIGLASADESRALIQVAISALEFELSVLERTLDTISPLSFDEIEAEDESGTPSRAREQSYAKQ